MKKIILSAILICSFSIISTAQFYEKDTVFLNKLIEGPGEQDFSVYVNIKNPSKEKDYTWTRKINGIAASWTTAVCDPFLCHGKTVNTGGYFLDSGATALMTVHFYMPDTAGGGQQGSVDIIVENDVTKVKDTATFIINVWNRRLNVATPNSNSFKLYPNPNTGSFTVSSKQAMQEVSITDLTGKVLSTQKVTDGATEIKLDNSHLPTGLYLVRVKSTTGITTSQKVAVNK